MDVQREKKKKKKGSLVSLSLTNGQPVDESVIQVVFVEVTAFSQLHICSTPPFFYTFHSAALNRLRCTCHFPAPKETAFLPFSGQLASSLGGPFNG